METFNIYHLNTLCMKHTEDQIHGEDCVYEASLELAKNFFESIKNSKEFITDAKNEIIRDAEMTFEAIDNVRGSNLNDPELVENRLRWYIRRLIEELNEYIKEKT